jgi:hypothetical protein
MATQPLTGRIMENRENDEKAEDGRELKSLAG